MNRYISNTIILKSYKYNYKDKLNKIASESGINFDTLMCYCFHRTRDCARAGEGSRSKKKKKKFTQLSALYYIINSITTLQMKLNLVLLLSMKFWKFDSR